MHSTTKLIAFSSAAFVLGATMLLGTLLFLAHTELGKALLRSYFTSAALSEMVSVNPTDIQTISTQPIPAASSTILVPKAYAGKEYYQAINRVVGEFNAMVSIATRLQPVLVAINEQSATGDYTGLLDRVAAAKTLISQEKAVAAKFAQDLLLLNTVNQSTPDSITKAQTQILVAKGNSLHVNLIAYCTSLDSLLSGAAPSNALVSETLRRSKLFSDDLQSFKIGMQPLLDRFADYITNKQ